MNNAYHATAMSRIARIGWGVFRLPLLFLVIFLFRHQIFTAIEQAFDIIGITLFAISIISTPVSRILFALFTSLIFIGIVVITRTMRSQVAYVLSLVVAFTLTVTMLFWLGHFQTFMGEDHLGVHWPAIFVLGLLATNWAAWGLFYSRERVLRIIDRLVEIVPGVGEIFFADRYICWLQKLWFGNLNRERGRISQAISGAVLAAICLTVVIPKENFVPLEQLLRSSSDVSMVAKGNMNEIVLDKSGRYLFANGESVSHILRFDTSNWRAEPLKSTVPTGSGQSLAYSPQTQEIFVYDEGRRILIVLNSEDLSWQRSIDIPNMSYGNPWISFDSTTDTLTVASEADLQDGTPLFVIDRATGGVLTTRTEEAGNTFLHPHKPVLYMSFYRRGNGIVAYNLKDNSIMASAPSDQRVHRMAYDPHRDEVLLASSADSRILRYDAQTLAPKGVFKATFGVRVIAVDPLRNVLLANSLVSGKVVMIDLATQKLICSWYLGPWLRSIVIAPERGVAYISSSGGLYELRYADRLRDSK